MYFLPKIHYLQPRQTYCHCLWLSHRTHLQFSRSCHGTLG
jgi:hypothetical protein